MPEMIPRELLPIMDMIVRDHPELFEQIQENSKDWIDMLATICADVGIVMDGIYSQADLLILESMLVKKLKQKNTSIILLN